MSKILSVDQVKKLPVWTSIRIVDEKTGRSGIVWVVKSGNRKMLKGVYATMKIEYRHGFHYEAMEGEPDD